MAKIVGESEGKFGADSRIGPVTRSAGKSIKIDSRNFSPLLTMATSLTRRMDGYLKFEDGELNLELFPDSNNSDFVSQRMLSYRKQSLHFYYFIILFDKKKTPTSLLPLLSVLPTQRSRHFVEL